MRLKMKKYSLFILLIIILGMGGNLFAQTADGGIFGNENTLTVKFKPSADIIGLFTGGNFVIRWLSSLGAGVNLTGETSSFGYFNQGPKETNGSYDYIVYASGNIVGSPTTTYTAGTEYTLMTVTVTGGTGTGTFELCPEGFVEYLLGADWYIEIGGSDRANSNSALWYYQSFASNVALPVELTSFSSKLLNDNVQLNWVTKTEVNNYGFNIERRINEGEWNSIGFVEGYGNSISPKEYSYTDKDLFAGGSNFQYRLKQIDTDGSFEYSDVVEVEVIPTQFELSQNYPNPFNPSTTIRFSLPQATQIKINLYNMIGEQVATIAEGMYETGNHKVTFSAIGGSASGGNAANLPSGAYFYRIESSEFVQVKKMMLLK
jgi:hypothetical protein